MIGLALIAAVVILIAWLLGGWARFVASALICIPALVVVGAVVGVLAFLAESLTHAIEHMTEPPRRR